MQRPCDVCGESYEAQRKTSKYCSSRCRVSAQRGASDVPVAVIPPADASETGDLETATAAELREVERDHSPLGLAAIALARRVDTGRDTGSGMAALVRQLGATLTLAKAGIEAGQTPLDRAKDELAARRAHSA